MGDVQEQEHYQDMASVVTTAEADVPTPSVPMAVDIVHQSKSRPTSRPTERFADGVVPTVVDTPMPPPGLELSWT